MRGTTLRRMVWVGVALAGMALVGCARHVSGKVYVDDQNTTKVEFKDEGKATVTILGSPQDTTYVEDGDTVTVKAPGGGGPDMVFKHNSDDSLGGPDGRILKRH